MTTPPIRLTRAQVREIDRRAIEEYHIPGIVLMENAARGVADAAMEMLGNAKWPEVLILCGGGNNGGDGLAAARHLHNRDVEVKLIFSSDPDKLHGEALINWQIAKAMALRVESDSAPAMFIQEADLVIDAVFGTGLHSPPRDTELINLMNDQPTPVLSVDLPSGLDCDTGEPLGACVRAKRTVTFVAEKAGFANPASKQYTGKITVAGIGCPRELIEDVARKAG